MDDFNLTTLTESRNEYSALFVSRLTPCIAQGITSIFNEACELCIKNDEDEKYLMTFQNLLGRVTRWNSEIIQNETERIIRESNCNYLEDLLTCVHVTQLKILTNVRVGTFQKKVSIDIPKLESFIHKCYIAVAREVYKNVFLYDKSVIPLMRQKNMRELHLIIKECILNVIRDNMPVEEILKSYLDDGNEEVADEEKTEIKEETEEVIDVQPPNNNEQTETEEVNEHTEEPVKQSQEQSVNQNLGESVNQIQEQRDNDQIHNKPNTLKFDDTDKILNFDNNQVSGVISGSVVESINAPKDVERLEQISEQRNRERKEEEDDHEDEDDSGYGETLQIHGDSEINLDVERIEPKSIKLKDDLILDDIEVLA